MEQIKRDDPLYSGRWVSIHDKKITAIECNEKSVVFHFANGFDLIDNDQVVSTKNGRIELRGCNSDEFDCHIIRRKTSRKGAKLYGKPISLAALGELLSQKEKTVEIYLELYDVNFMHLRGELCPYKKHGLSDCVVIETMDFFPMTYYWE